MPDQIAFRRSAHSRLVSPEALFFLLCRLIEYEKRYESPGGPLSYGIIPAENYGVYWYPYTYAKRVKF